MRRFILLGLIFLVGGVGAWLGQPYYQQAMARRLVHAAESAERRSDYGETFRLYSLAVQRDPKNLGVLRACAGFLAKAHHPQLFVVRQRIYNLNPNSVSDLLDYIEAALMFQQPKVARSLLETQASQKAKEHARTYHLLSVLHFVSHDLLRADAASAEAIRRDPANRTYQANQAIIRLSCPDPAIRQKALETLDQFTRDPEQGTSATQALLNDAAAASVEPSHLAAWLEAAQKWIPPQNQFFTAYLSALHRWRPAQFEAQLTVYLNAAALEPQSASMALKWLQKQGLFETILAFQISMPGQTRSASESLLITADAMDQLQRWDQLSAFLQTPEWSPVLRMAWSERLRRRSAPNESNESKASWGKIVALAKRNPLQLSTLAELADAWHWPGEKETTLWAMAEDPSLEQDALQSLSALALERSDGIALQQILTRQFKDEPENPAIANNLAFLSFLYRRDLPRAVRLSDELCLRFPDSPPLLATKAFGRLMAGDIPGGLDLFKKMDPQSLRGTAPGVTYGLLLAAQGDPRAADFLQDAERWTHFPEERQLIAAARKTRTP